MGIGELLEGWLFKIALKKGVKVAASVVLTGIASVKVAPVLTQLGVTIDPGQLEIGLMSLGAGLLTILMNYLKQKTAIGKKLL